MPTGVAAGFTWFEGPAGRSLRADALWSRARHVFTSRQLRFHRDSMADDTRRLAAALETEAARIVWVKQVHGRAVLTVTPETTLSEVPEVDAVVSNDPERAIAVRVADCVPVLLSNGDGTVVGAVHAGWRGTCAGVVAEAVEAMAALGAEPSRISAAIGPSIGPCCYQVDDRVRTTFLGVTPDAAAWFTEDGPGHWRLDLWQANADQLEASDVPPEAIDIARLCTADNPDDCYSYRREGPSTGRIVAAIRARSQEAHAAGRSQRSSAGETIS